MNGHSVPRSIPFVFFFRFLSLSSLGSTSPSIQHEPSHSNSPVFLFRLGIDDMGFLITGDKQQVIWIPAHLRGDEIRFHANTVVIGGCNGSVTIIRFNSDS